MTMLSAPSCADKHKLTSVTPPCPTCGGTLVTDRDDDAMTTLRCPRCSKRDVAGWLNTSTGYKVVVKLAQTVRRSLAAEVDEIVSELAVAILERQADAPADEEGFKGWLRSLATSVAWAMRRGLMAVTPVIEDPADGVRGLNEVPDQTDDENESGFETPAELLRYERNLKRRVRYQLGKLSASQREAIYLRYFHGVVDLKGHAKSQGFCPNRYIMAAWRGRELLGQRMDHSGYARKPTLTGA